jgi:(2Fe-2S) ferredoxin
VVYPEAVWYSYVDESDIDEIVQSHLRDGQVVERLLTPPTSGAESAHPCRAQRRAPGIFP